MNTLKQVPSWAWILGYFALVMSVSSCNKTKGVPEPPSEPASTQQVSANTSTPAETMYTPSWNYSVSTDKMSSKDVRLASVESSNTVSFDFPYQGEQRARLQLRRHPRFGNDVMLLVQRGQFHIGYNGTPVLVRFDDSAATRFTAYDSDDQDKTVIFIDGYKRFTEKMKGASIVRIEAPFYQEGNRVFEFDVSKFDDQW
ncbi:MAG: hypothetical protein LWW75_09225 [Chlorobiales bacterium]|nr:hypothetical protein [Chlorobiales bacterium]